MNTYKPQFKKAFADFFENPSSPGPMRPHGPQGGQIKRACPFFNLGMGNSKFYNFIRLPSGRRRSRPRYRISVCRRTDTEADRHTKFCLAAARHRSRPTYRILFAGRPTSKPSGLDHVGGDAATRSCHCGSLRRLLNMYSPAYRRQFHGVSDRGYFCGRTHRQTRSVHDHPSQVRLATRRGRAAAHRGARPPLGPRAQRAAERAAAGALRGVVRRPRATGRARRGCRANFWTYRSRGTRLGARSHPAD